MNNTILMKLKNNNKQLVLIILVGITSILSAFSQTKSPNEFLGYELGSRFTNHYKIINYFEHIATTNSNVKLVEYGETYEYRPLKLAFVTSSKNFSKLEEIRKNHLQNIGILQGQKAIEEIAIVWLSYNVHGNEAVSSEVSMKTLFELVNPNNTETKKWLENTIVIIDPCINPDGRERYVNWYTQNANTPFQTSLDSKEHHEPWPNGRANHYLFDLNRDWAWLSQKESQARIKIYNEWLPNVHVDFHEQGVNQPYYFAPAAEPYHEIVTDFQREFQKTIGENHAKYFDKNGWLYFTKEVFDLLYPSYGDTYPLYNGAIGMTYEQGGSGRGGLGVKIDDGSILTLKDRIAHHFTTSLSTIEVSSQHASELINAFHNYYNEKNNYTYNSYVISATSGKDKINNLTKFLDKHRITYGSPRNTTSINGWSYIENKKKQYKLSKNDLIITTNQPKSKLVKALFEPKAKLSDSLTYDITAWSLPYARGLHAYASSRTIETASFASQNSVSSLNNDNPYAYLCEWKSTNDVAFLSELLQQGIVVRFSKKPFRINGKDFESGTLIITKAGNKKHSKFNEIVRQAAKKHHRELTATSSGSVTSGSDFGSSKVSLLKAPKVAVLSGKRTSSLSFGAIWHFFEQQIKYPITVIDTDYFDNIDLNKYQVLILPSGYYGSLLKKEELKNLKDWIQNGGKLIAINNAVSTFAKSDLFSLSNRKSDDKKDKDDEEDDEPKLIDYADRQRNFISSMTTGAIFKTEFDKTNPLAFGYPDYYFTLKLDSSNYPLLKSGQNVAFIDTKNDLRSGFSGSKVQEKIDKTLVFGVESKGRGNVIYLVDDPLFRSFWENGKLLFSNAVFMVD
jgi:hypothetical protein